MIYCFCILLNRDPHPDQDQDQETRPRSAQDLSGNDIRNLAGSPPSASGEVPRQVSGGWDGQMMGSVNSVSRPTFSTDIGSGIGTSTGDELEKSNGEDDVKGKGKEKAMDWGSDEDEECYFEGHSGSYGTSLFRDGDDFFSEEDADDEEDELRDDQADIIGETSADAARRGTIRKKSQAGGRSKKRRRREEVRHPQVDGASYVVNRSDNRLGPHKIKVFSSDGDTSKWPQHVERTSSRETSGEHYFEQLDSKHNTYKVWIKKLGRFLAYDLGLVNAKWDPLKMDENWFITGFPSKYQLYVQHTGKPENRRTDAYLCGYPNGGAIYYRSPNEFRDHLKWLASWNGPDGPSCTCKYCGEQTLQTNVDRLRAGAEPIEGPLKASASRPRLSTTLMTPTTSSEGQTTTTRSPVTTKTHTLTIPNRDRELALLPEAPVPRPKELVWVPVSKTGIRTADFNDTTRSEVKISFWPGTTVYRTSSVPSVRAIPEQADPVPGQERVPDTDDMSVWTVRLLGTDEDVIIRQDEIVPYLAYTPPARFLSGNRFDPSGTFHVFDRETRQLRRPSIADFNTHQEALLTWCLAITIAGHIQSFWAPRDPVVYKPTFQCNAAGDFEVEWSYQGLWWGAEQIWCGDMVRLSIPKEERRHQTSQDGRLFMKIAAIYKTSEDKALISGTVYELRRRRFDTLPPPTFRKVGDKPQEPTGYTWYLLTQKSDRECQSTDSIAGRYYPRSSYKTPAERIGEDDTEDVDPDVRATVLTGLGSPRVDLTMGCRQERPDRDTIFKICREMAEGELKDFMEKYYWSQAG